jgi:hypothetical protein
VCVVRGYLFLELRGAIGAQVAAAPVEPRADRNEDGCSGDEGNACDPRAGFLVRVLEQFERKGRDQRPRREREQQGEDTLGELHPDPDGAPDHQRARRDNAKHERLPYVATIYGPVNRRSLHRPCDDGGRAVPEGALVSRAAKREAAWLASIGRAAARASRPCRTPSDAVFERRPVAALIASGDDRFVEIAADTATSRRSTPRVRAPERMSPTPSHLPRAGC